MSAEMNAETAKNQNPNSEQNWTVSVEPSRVSGSITPPASKSLCHRAIICASLAHGESILDGLSLSSDIEATIECMEALGARIRLQGRTGFIEGAAIQPNPKGFVLNARESGSTLRFLIPVAAAFGSPVTFLGKPSLLSRPMGIYADLFASQNLPFEQSADGIRFCGPLQAGLFEIPGDVSSQFISGLLLAAPLAPDGQGCEIAVLPPYQSRSYTSLTVSAMQDFGVSVDEPTDHGYIAAGDQNYRPAHLSIEADASQMAFFAVLAFLNAPLTICGIKKDSVQGDAVILSVLKECGAGIEWNADGDAVTVSPGERRAFTADLADCPDLGPILCTLAAYLPGESKIEHAARLRLKECDRIAAMEEELGKWDVEISSDEDSITIQGKPEWVCKDTVRLDGHNDHRIVMAMTIFGLCASSPSIIEGAQAVNKSYPGFFKDIALLNGKVVLE